MPKPRFLAPQNCGECPTKTPSEACFKDFNCALYDEALYNRKPVNVDRIAEDAAKYNPQSDWERDVEELRALIELGGTQ